MGESEFKTVKSWFPYEWFDTPEKLDFPGLPKYEQWYSRLKGEYVITREEWEGCECLFKGKGMRTFWFGFAEVDIEIPGRLRPRFEEMCPFSYNKTVPVEGVPKNMTDYLA